MAHGDDRLICVCGRRMTPEAMHAHMANCEKVPPEVRALNQKLGELLESDQGAYTSAVEAESRKHMGWLRRKLSILHALYKLAKRG